jgi:hypothetical protein
MDIGQVRITSDAADIAADGPDFCVSRSRVFPRPVWTGANRPRSLRPDPSKCRRPQRRSVNEWTDRNHPIIRPPYEWPHAGTTCGRQVRQTSQAAPGASSPRVYTRQVYNSHETSRPVHSRRVESQTASSTSSRPWHIRPRPIREVPDGTSDLHSRNVVRSPHPRSSAIICIEPAFPKRALRGWR